MIYIATAKVPVLRQDPHIKILNEKVDREKVASDNTFNNTMSSQLLQK